MRDKPQKTNAVSELVGHAKRVCREAAGNDHGKDYAAALAMQAASLRIASTLLEAESIRALLGLRAAARAAKAPPPEAL